MLINISWSSETLDVSAIDTDCVLIISMLQ